LGRDLLGGDAEVALVLAVGVVDQDHELAGADVRDRGLDRSERRPDLFRGLREPELGGFAHRVKDPLPYGPRWVPAGGAECATGGATLSARDTGVKPMKASRRRRRAASRRRAKIREEDPARLDEVLEDALQEVLFRHAELRPEAVPRVHRAIELPHQLAE